MSKLHDLRNAQVTFKLSNGDISVFEGRHCAATAEPGDFVLIGDMATWARYQVRKIVHKPAWWKAGCICTPATMREVDAQHVADRHASSIRTKEPAL